MASREVSLGVRVTPEMRQRLQKLARSDDRPMSSVVRKALEEYLWRRRKEIR